MTGRNQALMHRTPGDPFFSRSSLSTLAAWGLLVAAAILCAAYPRLASSELVPSWSVFTPESSDLPSDVVLALALGADDLLWVGTDSGLARLDKDGRWKTYSKASKTARRR